MSITVVPAPQGVLAAVKNLRDGSITFVPVIAWSVYVTPTGTSADVTPVGVGGFIENVVGYRGLRGSSEA